jgi:leucyl aminopeptidase
LPLWGPYDSLLDSKVADLNSAPGGGAGSVTAALFLRRFAGGAKSWAHFDIYAWNLKARAHGPVGGEIQAARALFSLLSARYPSRGAP